MKLRMILIPLLLILLSGCVYEPVHQGNRLSSIKVAQIETGMSKFRIEQLLGAPMLDHATHPDRVTYYEEFEEDGDLMRRGVEIVYDEALRAKNVRKFGFDKTDQ